MRLPINQKSLLNVAGLLVIKQRALARGVERNMDTFLFRIHVHQEVLIRDSSCFTRSFSSYQSAAARFSTNSLL